MLLFQSATVKDLRNWLKREVSIRVGRDTGKVKVVLCGHRYVSHFFGWARVD